MCIYIYILCVCILRVCVCLCVCVCVCVCVVCLVCVVHACVRVFVRALPSTETGGWLLDEGMCTVFSSAPGPDGIRKCGLGEEFEGEGSVYCHLCIKQEAHLMSDQGRLAAKRQPSIPSFSKSLHA